MQVYQENNLYFFQTLRGGPVASAPFLSSAQGEGDANGSCQHLLYLIIFFPWKVFA